MLLVPLFAQVYRAGWIRVSAHLQAASITSLPHSARNMESGSPPPPLSHPTVSSQTPSESHTPQNQLTGSTAPTAENFFLLPPRTPGLDGGRADCTASLRELANSRPGSSQQMTPSRLRDASSTPGPEHHSTVLATSAGNHALTNPPFSSQGHEASMETQSILHSRVISQEYKLLIDNCCANTSSKRSASVAFSDEAHDPANNHTLLVKYQCLAMEQGCTPEQALDVAKSVLVSQLIMIANIVSIPNTHPNPGKVDPP